MSSGVMNKEAIVIVPDIVTLKLISSTLSSVQLKVVEFLKTDTAFTYIRQNFQNIYLSVIDISDNQHQNFLNEIKENDNMKYIPILAIAGKKDNKVSTFISSAYSEKFDDLVFKPIDPSELLIRTSRLIQLRGTFFSMKDKMQGSNKLIAILENKLRDITRIYQSLEKTYQEQKQKAQEKEEYFYTIAHDLVSPLSNITLGVDFIAFENPNMDKNNLGILNSIKETAVRINQMVRDFLTLIKKKREGEVIHFEEMNPSSILEIVLREFYPRANDKDVLIMIEIDENIQNVYWDQSQILRVITNIVDNALRYSPENSTIKLTLKQIEDYSVFIIEDKGKGIPKNQLDKVFELFYQAENGKKGFGIGLAFCKKTVELHHGTIEINSVVNEGTAVKITLPNKPDKV